LIIDAISATTISATTYQNLPKDIYVTGGTYLNGTSTFTNNTGGTFNVSGFTTPFTGGTVSGETIFTNGLTANTISATTYQNLPKLQNVITVAKSGGDFTSIKEAVNSINDSSTNNRYVIRVAPGEYHEDEIILQGKEFISIVGYDILEVVVIANDPNQNIFRLGNSNELSFMTISGATNGVGILCYNLDGFSLVHKISMYDCDTNVLVQSDNSSSQFYGEYVDYNGTYSYGTRVLAYDDYPAYANMENYYNYPTGPNPSIANSVQGKNASLNVFVGDGVGNNVAGSINYEIFDNATLNTTTTTAEGWDYCVRNPNIGGPIKFDIDSLSVVDSLTYDVSVEHPGTFGTFNGSSTHTKIHSLSENVYWSFLDSVDGEFEITKKMSVTFSDGTHTDMSTLIFQGGTMGLISGGTITVSSGLTVNVEKGFGYLQNIANPTIYQRVDWEVTPITLTPSSNLYLYFNESGGLYTSGTRPTTVNNIVIGRVVTNSTGIEFIDSSPMNADHTSNKFANLFRNALGPIYSSGSIVTQNTTPFKLNVSSGEYYFSSNQYLPSGGSGFTFTQYYRNGLGGWNTSATTFVNHTQFDNNGTLSGLTSSAFTKHTLYLVGSGVDEKYFLVLGQNQYTTLVETENALLPTPPTFFNDSVTQIANIYIKQGNSNILQIEDIRPIIGFRAGGVSSSSLHANLLGLSSDDHKQYLLVDGSRNMSGVLNMGGNSIISAGTINNVTIQSHASRHKNGGADEIATSTPAASEIPKADTFGKLDSWISNSSSSVKGLTKLTVNPVSSTSPIAVGENDLRFQKSITGVTNTSGTLSFSNVTGGTTNFTGLTLGSVSATTYINADNINTYNGYSQLNNFGESYFGYNDGTTYTYNRLYFYTTDNSLDHFGTVQFSVNPEENVSFSKTNWNNTAYSYFTLSEGSINFIMLSNSGLTSNNFNFYPDYANFDKKVYSNESFVAPIFSATTYLNLPTDVRVTGGTYSNGTTTFTNNTGGTFNVTGYYNSGYFTGGTVTGATKFTNGLTANTISATTYQNLPTDVRVTGGTYSNGTATFTNNTGGTFNVTGLTTPFTGGTVSGATKFTNGLTANTISATTYQNLPTDVRVTGGTKSNSTVTFTNNTGGTFNVTGFSDTFVTGGTYSSGTAIFTNNTGGTFNVVGFSTGFGSNPGLEMWYVNYNGLSNGDYLYFDHLNRIYGSTLLDSNGQTWTNNTSNTLSFNLDVSVDWIGDGNQEVIKGLIIEHSTLGVVAYNSIATNINYDLSGQYPNSVSSNIILEPGENFKVKSYIVIDGSPFHSVFVDGTLNITSLFVGERGPKGIQGDTGPSNILSIGTVTSGVTASATISGTSPSQILNLVLPKGDKGDTGATGAVGTFTGGTITGATNFTNGLTANTISATTYQNLPTDVRVTGGTYSGSTIIFTNNTGGTFNVTGITTSSAFTGGTVSGATSFTNGLTANTISSTTISATTYNGYTPANQDGTILYHSLAWFTPSGTTSSSGTSVTSSLGQFTSAMVNAKLTISGESRIITGYTSPTAVTVNTSYSQNYSNVPSGGTWGVYSKVIEILPNQYLYYNLYDSFGVVNQQSNGTQYYIKNLRTLNNNLNFVDQGYVAGGSRYVGWTNNTSGTNEVGGSLDTALRRNSAGILEIYDGVAATGLLANRRDLLVRNISGSSLNISGTISATTYLNLPSSGGSFTGGTVTGATNFTGGLTATTISATTITSPSVKTYGLIVATSLGYQNIF
jgi:hypothetical protein